MPDPVLAVRVTDDPEQSDAVPVGFIVALSEQPVPPEVVTFTTVISLNIVTFGMVIKPP